MARQSARIVDSSGDANIWAGYDAERVRTALGTSAGALSGVDLKALKADVRAARAQSSAGHPAE